MVTVRVLRLAGAILALAGCCHTGQLTQSTGATARTSASAELVTQERKWVDAVYGRDSTTLSSLESDDFVAIIPSGSLDKAEQLRASGAAAAAAAKSSPGKPPEITIGQQLVSLYGDVAVVTDKITLAGGPSNPVSTPGTYWQTEVWRYQDGVWKISRLHISPVEHGM